MPLRAAGRQAQWPTLMVQNGVPESWTAAGLDEEVDLGDPGSLSGARAPSQKRTNPPGAEGYQNGLGQYALESESVPSKSSSKSRRQRAARRSVGALAR